MWVIRIWIESERWKARANSDEFINSLDSFTVKRAAEWILAHCSSGQSPGLSVLIVVRMCVDQLFVLLPMFI